MAATPPSSTTEKGHHSVSFFTCPPVNKNKAAHAIFRMPKI
jgi:hypothetical protein